MKKRKLKQVSLAFVMGMLMASTTMQEAKAADTIVAEKGIANFQQGDASITIQGNEGQTLNGKVFQVYQLFHAENALGMESINYTVNEPYRTSLQAVIGKHLSKAPASVSEYDMIDYIQELGSDGAEGADAPKQEEGRYSDYRYFVEELRSEIVARKVSGKLVRVAETKADNSVIIDGLEYGYYIVDEVSAVQGTHTAASLCIVSTANPDSELRVKSDYPSVIKKIQEDDNRDKIGNNGWNDIADFAIGQRVPYKYESNIPNMNGYKTYYYAWHDVMDEALTFQEQSVKITIYDNKSSSKSYELQSNEYRITKNTANGETFQVEVPDIKQIVDREFNRKNQNGENEYGQKVVLTYEAILNDKAAEQTGRAGFENDVRLEFSNDADSDHKGSTGLTPWDTVVCFTYKINGLKINNHNQNLKDAKFRLYADEACKEEIYVKKVGNGYHVIHRDSAGTGVPKEAVEMVSDSAGKFEIYGIDSGVYYLKETAAPAGYRPLTAPVVLRVSAQFPNDRNRYVKGDGATEQTLQKLTASAHVQKFLDGAVKEEDFELETEENEGSLNLSIINVIGKKLPVTGSAAMLLSVLGGSGMMAYAFIKGRKKDE